MPEIAVGGTTIAYHVEGPRDAPAVLFSNSLGADRSMWTPQATALRRRYRVIRYDTRGHGESAAPEGPYAIDQLADDALAVLDALGVAQAHFCGLSLGGLTGQAIALKAPERLRSLVLANTAAHIPPSDMWNARIRRVERDGLIGMVDDILDRWFTPTFAARAPGIFSQMRTMLASIDPSGYAACCAAVRDADFREMLGAMTTPTLILCGEDDVATPPAASEALADGVPGAQFARIADAAHISNIEQPAVFTDAISAFFANT